MTQTDYQPGQVFAKLAADGNIYLWVLMSRDIEEFSHDTPVWTAAKFYTDPGVDYIHGAQTSFLYDSDIAGMKPVGSVISFLKTNQPKTDAPEVLI